MQDSKPAGAGPTAPGAVSRLRALVVELRDLEERLRQGGGPERVQRQHDQGKRTARERIELLRDPGTRLHEIGLLVAWDQYEGEAPSAGVVTGLAQVADRPVVVRGTAHWERVEELRLWEGVPAPSGPVQTLGVQSHRAFREAFILGRFDEAVAHWKTGGWQPRGPRELRAVAQALAMQGEEAALPHVERVRQASPVEADLLLALLRMRRGHAAEATDLLTHAFVRLQADPWPQRELTFHNHWIGVYDKADPLRPQR